MLSHAATRAALGEAIARARGEGALDGFVAMLAWPGFRKRLRTRIADWTRGERPIDAGPAGIDPLQAAQWAVFLRYRAILRTLDAEDDEGFAVWASRALLEAPPLPLRRPGAVTILDLEDDTRATWRVLEYAHARARSVQVTLVYESDEELAEVYCTVAPLRRRLLDRSFVEVAAEPEIVRPPALRGVERELFRRDAHTRPRLKSTPGLTVIGAPQEGMGLVLAREVESRLRESDPEDVLVLFRRWDHDAALVLETLRAWNLPVAAAVARPMANEPAVSALRMAMKLPIEGWEAERLVRFLRHGQVRPRWPEARAPMALAVAATAVHSCRVFRGRDALRRALDRPLGEGGAEGREATSARLARDVVGRLINLLDPLDRPGRWPEQAMRLRGLAEDLRLGHSPADDEALDALWAALDDHGAVLEDLGWGRRTWSWPDFVQEVEAMVGDLSIPAPDAGGGRVRLATIDEVAGARAEHILVGNLAEGTFPVREAVEADLDRAPGESTATPDPAFAREMLRFLRVVGSAESGLVLVHPTTDTQGQGLLKAGFLDDLLRLFDEDERPAIHEESGRFDPALLGRPDLAHAPADRRVRAVALACSEDQHDDLTALARSAEHRTILLGTAAALSVAHQRARSRSFGNYDGRLGDPAVMERIAAKFGNEYCFSPSQLESYIFCPFQFYLRYVLKFEPVDDRDEFEEDYVGRGSRVHNLLEQVEQLRSQGDQTMSRLELAMRLIEAEMTGDSSGGSGVEAGLRQIERRRLIRTIERYVRQHEAYERLDPRSQPVPRHFEFVFGHEDDSRSHPHLTLGDGVATVRLQGKIDRIDLLPMADGRRFRIIDYKTGPRPSKKDVKESLYLQLPLYAMAVARRLLDEEGATLHDVGYWGLSADGFKPIALQEWDQDRARLEGHVIALVNHLRHGVFPIDPRKDDCTQRCEYHAVCRIRQIRTQGKRREDALRLELKVR